MSVLANNDEAAELLARPRDQQTDMERRLLAVARDVFRGVHRLRVIRGANPATGQPGYGWVICDTESRRGHAVGGHVGWDTEAAAVQEERLRIMARTCARNLSAVVLTERVVTGRVQ